MGWAREESGDRRRSMDTGSAPEARGAPESTGDLRGVPGSHKVAQDSRPPRDERSLVHRTVARAVPRAPLSWAGTMIA